MKTVHEKGSMNMKNNESTDSFSFRLLIALGWAMMALQFVGIVNIGWVLIFHYWLLLIALYVGLFLLVGIIAGIVAMVQNHKE